ncbi:MAG: hypothetical protein AAED33_06895 [Paracoccaceae bacterium]|jgi:hypothetical protein
MRQTTRTGRKSSEKIVKDIKRATRKQLDQCGTVGTRPPTVI